MGHLRGTMSSQADCPFLRTLPPLRAPSKPSSCPSVCSLETKKITLFALSTARGALPIPAARGELNHRPSCTYLLVSGGVYRQGWSEVPAEGCGISTFTNRGRIAAVGPVISVPTTGASCPHSPLSNAATPPSLLPTSRRLLCPCGPAHCRVGLNEKDLPNAPATKIDVPTCAECPPPHVRSNRNATHRANFVLGNGRPISPLPT